MIRAMFIVGIDVGGTFTDLTAVDEGTGRVVVTLASVDKSYGGTVVYRELDLTVERGDRIALVGLNGAGKSTLLRILAGVLPFEQGTRTLGANVSVHYYAQHQLDALNSRNTVLEELATIADVVPLVDENRALASAGLRALACTRRPGLARITSAAAPTRARATSAAQRRRLTDVPGGRAGRPRDGTTAEWASRRTRRTGGAR